MYPVISILRRAAGPVVYVRPNQLSKGKKGATIRLSVATPYVDLSTGEWTSAARDVRLFQIVVSAKSSEGAAVALAAKENEIAEALSLSGRLYTLVVGSETETVADGVFTRTFRVGIVKGIFGRVGSSNSLRRLSASKNPPKDLKGKKKRLPPGVILENR